MNSSRFTLCALAGAVTLALQVQAFAEESTIVVTGSEQGSALPAWTNSATKSAVAESKTPQVINTLSAPEIEKRHANSVNEILRYAPGVSTEVRGNTSYMSEYKIRGFTVDQEFYNGLQLPYNVTGNTKARIDPLLIDSVDILKGPSSVLYGGGSPGGLVNIQSKKPQREARTEVGFNTGNRNLKEGYLDSTGQIADSDWNYRLLGKATENDDQPHTTRYENYLVAPSVTWQPDSKTRLTLDALAQNSPSLTPSNPLRCLICARNMPIAVITPEMNGVGLSSASGCWAIALNTSLTAAGALTRKRAILTSIPTSAASMRQERGVRFISSTALLTPPMKILRASTSTTR
jgi:iron complex outermembrane receptor protein